MEKEILVSLSKAKEILLASCPFDCYRVLRETRNCMISRYSVDKTAEGAAGILAATFMGKKSKCARKNEGGGKEEQQESSKSRKKTI